MSVCTEQELLDFMREKAYKPMTYQELEKNFGIDQAEDFKIFLKMLNEMEQDGKILLTRNQRYGVPERMNLLRGRLQSHPKGFAFLIADEPGHPDVYIHANDLKGAMNGDTVLVRVTSRSDGANRMEGEIVRIARRAVTEIVGLFENHNSFGFVIPDDKRINKDIFIKQEGFKGAVTGQKVVAKIVRYPEGRSSAAEGEIIEILGHKDDPGVDILSIIRKHGLPESFPEDVMAEAEAAPDTIAEEEIAAQGRRDLRGKTIVTIDGEDAKDLDDAVNVERLENGNWLLGVHIADVSYYVQEHSKLDQEAYNRGCSVYLVDRVIPMLPRRLSNGICSLNPQVDRLTMSCEMEFEPKTLKRVRYDVFTSVIRTKERMTYTNVRKILHDEDPEVAARYADLAGMFREMEELAMGLRAQRMRRGAIDFEFQESKVIVDEQGKPIDIVKRERSTAEQIIEEFMLAANETVAEHFHWLKVPFLYRIHEEPEGDKLMHFMQFAANFGYAVRGKGNSVHPRALQTLLEQIRGTKEETVISTMMLRSMKQAKYNAESLGHFGLAAEFYSHFTSPIRRYPDLVIHRIIREVLAAGGGGLPEARHEALAARMTDIAQQSSERERVAVEAERDTEKLKKAEFMLDKIGEEFDGIISGVTGFGMFVELDNTVEGLIRLSDLSDDYYHFHEQHMALIGERTSRVFRIGDEVRIRVARVNMEEYTIDFEIVNMKPRGGGKSRGAGAIGEGAGLLLGRKRKKRGVAAPLREERAGLGGGRKGGGKAKVRREEREGAVGKGHREEREGGVGKRQREERGSAAVGKGRRGNHRAAADEDAQREDQVGKPKADGGAVAVAVPGREGRKRGRPAAAGKAPAAVAKPNRRAGKLDMWGLPISGNGLKDDGGEQEALAEMRKANRRGGGARRQGAGAPSGTEPNRRRKRKE